jgi:hypothetical protein
VSYLHRPEQLPTLMLFAAVWPNLRQLHISKPQYLQLLHNTAAAAVFGAAGAAASSTAAADTGLARSPSKQLLQLQTDWADWLAGPIAAAANSSSLAPLLNLGGGALGAALAATAAAAAAAASSGAVEALPQLQAALAAAAAAVVQLSAGSITSLCSGSSGSSSSGSVHVDGASPVGSAVASSNTDVSKISNSSSSSSQVQGRMAFAGTSATAAASNIAAYGPDGPALHLVAGIVLSGCHWPQLQSLSLSRLGLTPAAAQLLAQAAAQWPLLRLLNVSHNKLGAAGLQSLLQAAASHWHGLEVLDVRGDRGAGVQQHGSAADRQQQRLGLLPAVAAAAAAAVGLSCEPWIGASSSCSSSTSSSKQCVFISVHAGGDVCCKQSELQGMLLDAATGSSSSSSSSVHWLGPLQACSTLKDGSSSSSRRRVQPLHLLVL